MDSEVLKVTVRANPDNITAFIDRLANSNSAKKNRNDNENRSGELLDAHNGDGL